MKVSQSFLPLQVANFDFNFMCLPINYWIPYTFQSGSFNLMYKFGDRSEKIKAGFVILQYVNCSLQLVIR